MLGDLLMRDWDGRDVNQIGRQPPLSSNKAETHFPRLREATGVTFDEMLFFDDCNWVRCRDALFHTVTPGRTSSIVSVLRPICSAKGVSALLAHAILMPGCLPSACSCSVRAAAHSCVRSRTVSSDDVSSRTFEAEHV